MSIITDIKHYRCMECKQIATASEWDEATKISFGEPTNISKEDINDYFYFCPNCHKEVSVKEV